MHNKIREIRVDGKVAYVHLTKGYVATIDAADVPLVSYCNWCCQERKRSDGFVRTVYVVSKKWTGGKWTRVYLHRLIMSPPEGMQVDHISGDGLDCRRVNMRLATPSQNSHNQRLHARNVSGVKGVSWNKRKKLWTAFITVNYKQKHIGYFSTIETAAVAIAQARLEHHGEFGRTE